MAKKIKVKTRLGTESKSDSKKDPDKKIETKAVDKSQVKQKELKSDSKEGRRPKRLYAPYSRMFKLRAIDIKRQNEIIAKLQEKLGGRRIDATKSIRGAMYLADTMPNNRLLKLIWESQKPVQGPVKKGPVNKSYSFFNSEIEYLKKITERLNSENIDGRKITVTSLLQGLILLANKTSSKKLIESYYEIQKRNLINKL